MGTLNWETAFEASVAAERAAMIALIDASRALQAEFREPGASERDALDRFAERLAQWQGAVRDVTTLAEQRAAGR